MGVRCQELIVGLNYAMPLRRNGNFGTAFPDQDLGLRVLLLLSVLRSRSLKLLLLGYLVLKRNDHRQQKKKKLLTF
jgi:hypothetical protein